MITSVKNEKLKAKEASKQITLKERKDVKYYFFDDDVEEMFDELLASNALKLPEPKRLA